MTQFHWRIPIHGCKGDLASPFYTRGTWGPLTEGKPAPTLTDGSGDRFPYHDYLLEVAKAAEISGFDGALIPSFPDSEDPWVIASSIARHTRSLRFMIAYQPCWFNPLYAAKAAASLQRLSGGRLLFNIITGGGGPPQLWWGDRIAHDDRYTRTTEFLDVLKGVWNGGPFNYNGKFFQIEEAGLPEPLAGQVFPELYFVGSSNAALAAQGKHADYDLTHLEPRENLRNKFNRVKELASRDGRTVKPAVRFNIIARPTPEEAWEVVRRAWAQVDWDARERNQRSQRLGDGVGSWRTEVTRSTRVEDLVFEGLWAGFGTLGSQGSPLGFVGSYEQAAETIDGFIRMGVQGFILSSTPALEEAFHVGEEVLPLVRGSTSFKIATR
ncbi:LLM class flavin-dependent oxidoreductase [Candidatus Methylospira mobilis]|uniref:LLM class flavin-dependent oxidoreductase n=1 Tax=Candidatus Methylospira mobilis TaxID=1808979 RepID=A0A5Q0BKG7_9GAMM|nr:LLM class flavin-dependent oxidoreductase [Candidatus Methylospira mobilis]QFY42704.1 LLM class flavin-dependent oxidoreductase [Candidatus Methylospira mobilis]